MPEITAFSKVFRDLDALVGACAENAKLIPGAETLKAELEAGLAKARDAKLQQESLEGNRLAATANFMEKADAAKDGARKLRSFIVSVLGPRSPYLSLFGITPKPAPNLSPRRRRKTQAETPAPATTQPAAPAEPAREAEKQGGSPG